MKHLALAMAYLAVALFFYTKTSLSMNEELDKKEFLNGTFYSPNRRAAFEVIALLFAVSWFVSIPLIVAHKLVERNR